MAPAGSWAGASLLSVIRVPFLCAVAPQSSVLLFAPPASMTFSYPGSPSSLWGMPVLRRPGAAGISSATSRGGSSRTANIQGRKTLTVRANAGREAKIESRRTVAGTRWLELQQIEYKDESGVSRKWDAVSRPGIPDVCAVAVMPILKSKGAPDQVMLITQFRPAVGKYCIEVPAGLIEPGANMRETATRELLEETGLTATSFLPDDAGDLLNDPGITPTAVKLLVALVDTESPENVEVNAKGHDRVYGVAEEGEYIRRKIVPLDDLRDSLIRFEQEGFSVDGKLMCFARGIKFGQDMAKGKLF